jgi:hypothetical protein
MVESFSLIYGIGKVSPKLFLILNKTVPVTNKPTNSGMST